MTRIAILGAGVTGLVIANRLAATGAKVDVIEAGPVTGGNQKSVDIGPYTFDIGTFIFPSFSPFFEEFPEVWPLYHQMHYAPVRITPKGNVHAYPFDAKRYLREQGPVGSALSLGSLAVGKLANIRKRDVGEYAKYYVGRRIYEQSGLQTYIERLFGLPDHRIDTVFAAKRMSEIANVGSFRNIFRQKILRQSRGGAFQWAIRPRSGFQTVFTAIRDLLETRGVTFHLNTPIAGIEKTTDCRFELSGDGFAQSYDRVLSTIPLPILGRLLGIDVGTRFPTLRLYSLFYAHKGDLGFKSGTLYNFSPDGLWKRTTVLSEYYGQAEGHDYFSVEVTVDEDAPLTVSDIQDDFERHVRSVGLMRGTLERVGHEETRNAYPLYPLGQRDRIEAMKAKLTASGVEVVGRQGQFDYIPSAALATEKATGFLETGRWPD